MKKSLKKVEAANVRLWGQRVGAVAWDDARGLASFEYDPNFIKSGLEVAPLMMPLRSEIYTFPGLKEITFHGLPGMLADALPDRFGNRLIEIWLAQRGRALASFTPVERLCYMGRRGMGALEFQPAYEPRVGASIPIEVSELVELANQILYHKNELTANFYKNKHEAIQSIIRVGTSAGGNRAKAVIAWNPKTGEIRSGQVNVPKDFEPWILKFDGVEDDNMGNTRGYGRIEYAYHKMAVKAGICMNPCQLLEENGRAHFMTKRFDRTKTHEKIHVQSLCAMAHFDFNAAGEYSYEQAFNVIVRLGLSHEDLREMYRRMVFNVLARNQDDHTRNIAFLMDSQGHWGLAPAFDVIWAHNPEGEWTNRHQMKVNGKRDGFSLGDLEQSADYYKIKGAGAIIEQVSDAVNGWMDFAQEARVSEVKAVAIGKTHRNLIK
ncbi:MAG: type II toxin-antitoxin system HipA family toxin [Candidatus Omnitrophica bacterium]|nr:type II toxin-antitoxin system HipA family toxin [Candidatus Omnitrophota bacterium]